MATQELETDVVELILSLASQEVQDAVFCEGGVTEAGKQQLRDALNALIDERVAWSAGRSVATPPRWRKGEKLIRRGNIWSGIVTPADRNVYVVTRDSWAESPSWVEPIETAKI